ncbi:MAG: pyridoxal-phosphate dependent enzyme [Acidimicrobiales bacterium]
MSLLDVVPAGYGLEVDVVDESVRDRAVQRFREANIALPTFAQMADPTLAPPAIVEQLAAVDPDAADPLNLWRVHWFNHADRRGRVDIPGHVVIPPELSGVPAPIVMLIGDRFPMITAHKVLAAYSCLAPRLVTGQFDPTANRAVWPSTGNYARGGIAISRIMGCRGVAVLPEGMSAERFEWLDDWVNDPADVIRTPGSESNVKEIYDACARLAAEPDTVVLNQFCEYGNHLGHVSATARAADVVFEHLRQSRPELRMAAYVSASGSAGTLGAGDALKDQHGARVAVVEALECPTLLYNGYGEHNIQGIGDKHVPLIHNVANTDYVIGVSDQTTDELDVLFNNEAGRAELARKGVDQATIDQLVHFGFSSSCNLVASIKLAKHLDLGPDDVIVTIATDGSAMYNSERSSLMANRFPQGLDSDTASSLYDEHLGSITDDHLLELVGHDADRVFNLGYFTWVEQQGVELDHFDARRDQAFWQHMRDALPRWDELIDEFNDRTGVLGE